jgi:hypothetical protein
MCERYCTLPVITRFSSFEVIRDDDIEFSSYKKVNTFFLILIIIGLSVVIPIMQIKNDILYIFGIIGIVVLSFPLLATVNNELVISKNKLYVNNELFDRIDLQIDVNETNRQLVLYNNKKKTIIRNKFNIIEIRKRLIDN